MLKRQSKNFQRFHNKHNRYSCLRGKTANQVLKASKVNILKIGANTKVPKSDEFADGNVILIRFIRSNCVLDVFGVKFKVSKELIYSYVKAVIVTKIYRLQLYLGNELIDAFDDHLPTRPWH